MFAQTLMLAVLLGQPGQPATTSTVPPQDQSQMSLAERAAAARKAAAERRAQQAQLSQRPAREEFGSVREGKYINDFFHFQIELSGRWTPLNAERTAAADAKAAEIASEYGIRHTQSDIALNMEDSTGSNVILKIEKIPPGQANDLAALAEALKGLTLRQAPEARELQEQQFLGDDRHKFHAFRYGFRVQGHPLVQSKQFTRIGDYLLMFDITGSTTQEVSDALTALQSRLKFSR